MTLHRLDGGQTYQMRHMMPPGNSPSRRVEAQYDHTVPTEAIRAMFYVADTSPDTSLNTGPAARSSRRSDTPPNTMLPARPNPTCRQSARAKSARTNRFLSSRLRPMSSDSQSVGLFRFFLAESQSRALRLEPSDWVPATVRSLPGRCRNCSEWPPVAHQYHLKAEWGGRQWLIIYACRREFRTSWRSGNSPRRRRWPHLAHYSHPLYDGS